MRSVLQGERQGDAWGMNEEGILTVYMLSSAEKEKKKCNLRVTMNSASHFLQRVRT